MKRIPLVKLSLDELEANAASETILSGWVTQGPQVAAFEQEFTRLVGAAYACAVCNCTAALHLALKAVGVSPGDEVITVSYSFLATANAIRYLDATPVFIDIDAGSYTMDPELIEAAVTPRTKAVLCVHQLGMPCNLESIIAVSRKHGLKVVEDAACGIGSEIRIDGEWQPIGRPHSDAACFSFHPRKVLTTGDGGMICTNDPEVDRKVRLWRQHAMSVTDLVRSRSEKIVAETFDEIGYNYRLTDIQAAIGRKQLQKLYDIISHRRALGGRYRAILGRESGIGIPNEPLFARSNWQTFSVTVPDGCDRNSVMQRMRDLGVETRRPSVCCHLEASHADLELRFELPVSERTYEKAVAIPLYPQMSRSEQDRVIEALLQACEHS